MSRLAPNLFERRYGDLVEIGRSRLPSYAPAWTDYNAHDPGITLIELAAWVAEAQLYSLARTRRDERRAYAALMGVEPHGTRPATGLIWPDHDDAAGPSQLLSSGLIIDPDTMIHLETSETPTFRATRRQAYISAKIVQLKSRLANGVSADLLEANRRGGPAFQPFGAEEGQDAVLRMKLEATGHAPLFASGSLKDTCLVIGIRADTPRSSCRPCSRGKSPIEVTLDYAGHRTVLRVIEDSSNGMQQTGCIILNVGGVEGSSKEATLEFRAPAGFARAPRITRIEPNVVPIFQQLKQVDSSDGNGRPDQGFDLEEKGIEFEPGTDPVEVEVELLGARKKWSRAERLEDSGPDDLHFTLDPVAARIAFGNGVNGSIPPANSKIFATYSFCDGKAGNIAANRKWVVGSFAGVFGTNLDPTSGGDDASGWLEQRREAREITREHHALVSARDFEKAALALPGLQVGRARMMPPSDSDVTMATMRLVVLRTRDADEEAGLMLETPRWLEGVRSELEPRVPLGSRLRIVAPQYTRFSIEARVEAEPRMDPDKVRLRVFEELSRRLTLVRKKPVDIERAFGLPVSRRDAIAWIQKLGEVRRVLELTIRLPGKGTVDEVKVPKSGLPLFDAKGSQIDVVRSAGTGAA